MDPNVQVALVSAGGMIAVALVGVVVEFLRRQSSTLGEVREQVSNTHSTNLRDDVDRVLRGLDQVLEGQAEHGREIAGLRAEIRHERAERLAVAERLDDHMASAAP
ncbi:DUF2746 domain-containing protein [Streptodolium elevatio]|uniref:DUF2746 domain-containing protein n=1 Tax=Streptodolium elevatio TaxID=3157996 RepID=A0ABV3DBV3_9ACTN